MADRTAWRICRDNRWWSAFGRKRGMTKEAGLPVHDDLVRRDFTAEGLTQPAPGTADRDRDLD